MLICLQSAERVRRLALETLRELLTDSDQVEAGRDKRLQVMLGHATGQGRNEAFDAMARLIETSRRLPERPTRPALIEEGRPGRAPGRGRR